MFDILTNVKVNDEKKGSNKERPLIDTGELRKSITYVIRDKGGNNI